MPWADLSRPLRGGKPQPPRTKHKTPTNRPPTNQAPSTKHQAPTTDHRPPATGHRPPTTDHRPPTTDHRPPATGHRPRARQGDARSATSTIPLAGWGAFKLERGLCHPLDECRHFKVAGIPISSHSPRPKYAFHQNFAAGSFGSCALSDVLITLYVKKVRLDGRRSPGIIRTSGKFGKLGETGQAYRLDELREL